jgi:uncharacterized protein
MKDQYQVLSEIKKIEDKYYRLHWELERIPEEIAKINARLKEKEDEFKKIKSGFDDYEKKQRTAEMDLREREEALKKAESKMMEVKTNEEYQAALKENETQKKEKAKFEETVLLLISKVEEQRALLKESEKNFLELQKSLNDEKAVLEEERKKLAIHYEELCTKKNSSASLLKPEIATIYERIARRGEGPAIAFAQGGLCGSCSMKILPQRYNEMLGFKSLHRCGHCGRLLIIEPQTESA